MNTNSTAHGTARPARRRRRPFPSALWIAADTLLVLGVAGGLWLGYANRVPNVTVPEPEALPVNGYDRLREAAAKIVRREDVDAAVVAWDSPDLVGQRNATPAQRETLVAENAATLAALRGAMAMPVRVTPLRTTDQLFPELADIRGAARLIRLEGDVHAARGENAQAAASYLDAMELGNDLMPDSWMIPRLVGIACEAIGRRPLVPLADALSADEARAAAARLEAMAAARPPIADTFEQEKWGTQRILLHEFRKGRIDDFAAGAVCVLLPGGETAEPDLPMRAMVLARTFPLTKAGVLKANAEYMDRVIASARRPYPEAMRPIGEPKDVINQILAPVFGPVVHKEADARAQNALLLGKLALRAYQQERSDLPASLGEIVAAGYLNAAPADPFAPDGKASLRYRRLSATEYHLYSVGPDGGDDGGRPLENRGGAANRQRQGSEQESTGDFVLGANLH